jgi:deazaflavin-dependent oxidoreductase (nitroreductase family)
MKKRTALLMAAAGAAYALVVRPWYMRWGTTPDETHRTLPGDDLTPTPMSVSTRAITIVAPASAVWPWLAQLGYRRGGWYSYDVVERALLSGDYAEGHSARRIHPELQHLQVGDRIPFGPGVSFPVTAIQPGHYLVIGNSWAFVLEPFDDERTRLIVRSRGAGVISALFRPRWAPRQILAVVDHVLNYAIFEPFHFVMEREMLLGIKRRAEGRYEPGTRRWLDRLAHFNKLATNRLAGTVAGRHRSPFALVHHRGRRSGRAYTTPVVAFPIAGGFVIPLPYGADADWCRNVLLARRTVIEYDGNTYAVHAPEVVDAQANARALPPQLRRTVRTLHIARCLRLTADEPVEAPGVLAAGVAGA